MAGETAAQLRARISQLEAENTTLKAENTTLKGSVPDAKNGASVGKRRSRSWTVLATALIVLGALLAPVAVVGSWINASLTSTDQFVATYAPLSQSPAVQEYVAGVVTDAIEQQVDIPALTSDVIDGVIDLGTGPAATRALEILKAPAAAGISSLIDSGVNRFVASEAFSTVWASSLRLSHEQFLAAMTGDASGVVVVSGTGEVGVQLSPIIDEIKKVLIAQGLTFANQIPSIDRTIVVAQSDALPLIQLAYGIAVGLGYWLPLMALLFLVAGVLVARRRAVALIWAAIAVSVSMVITISALAAGNLFFIASVSTILPSTVAGVLFAAVTAAMQHTAIAVLVISIALAVVAWLAGPFETPVKLRALAQSAAASIRQAADQRGLSTGAFGEWMYRHRVLLRIAVAVVAASIVVFVRPLSPSLTLWTLVIGAIVVAVFEVLERPTGQSEVGSGEAT